ncbi:thiol-disulfide oxidoreductase DCC family protein [Desertibacillus haloalkaliphilus]|uniref:thiol-disulfide oxidoreductase DCC family protein n=1 Tax=Desertibacillus haloalkaliphilus TaxID=1328930 RepID=UPI001C2634F4|nr:DCC1-like thiol-disulfide oxidoreductase family protein [Desertibacillus haloalkaliphilus]MBU8907982.1 DUF393 domain-containing protein [Desertibacillus haloalkaliphilus]
MGAVILFDGECSLCNISVQFIIKRDPSGYFQFASLQSQVGQTLLKEHGIEPTVTSLVVFDADTYALKSSAVIQICKHLTQPWKLFTVFRFIPLSFRDFLYDLVSKNRKKIVRAEVKSCMLPTTELKKRFLD